MNKHYDDLQTLLNSLNISMSIIIFTETWLKHDVTNIYAITGYTAIHNCRPNQLQDGTAIYYPDELECIKSTCTGDKYGEYTFAKFKSKN